MNNKPKILVSDDDEGIRLLLDRTLTQAGFDVETHAKLDEVITTAFEDHFDLIVTNYVMDDIQGLVIVHSLRGNGKEAPVVMITGSFHPGIFSAANKVDINHVTSKPFKEETVVEVVHRLLKQSREKLVA